MTLPWFKPLSSLTKITLTDHLPIFLCPDLFFSKMSSTFLWVRSPKLQRCRCHFPDCSPPVAFSDCWIELELTIWHTGFNLCLIFLLYLLPFSYHCDPHSCWDDFHFLSTMVFHAFVLFSIFLWLNFLSLFFLANSLPQWPSNHWINLA